MNFPAQRLGLLIVLSGPSGTGKTTLARRVCDRGQAIFSVSCTTRAPRPGEVDGRDYFFLQDADFVAKINRGEFFEHANVHGRRYGTLKSYIVENLQSGTDVILDIDVQGAAQIRSCEDEHVRRCLLDLFVMPPSLDELRARLSARATEDTATFELRMKNASEEMAHWQEYSHVLISGSREEDAAKFEALLTAARLRSSLRSV